VPRVVGEGDRALVDMPFTRTPAASCAGTVMTGPVSLMSNELESVTITTSTPSFAVATPSITRTSLSPSVREACP